MDTIRLDSNLEQDDHPALNLSKDMFTTDWAVRPVRIDDDLLNNEDGPGARPLAGGNSPDHMLSTNETQHDVSLAGSNKPTRSPRAVFSRNGFKWYCMCHGAR